MSVQNQNTPRARDLIRNLQGNSWGGGGVPERETVLMHEIPDYKGFHYGYW